jgi:hypothetical protein
MALLDINIIGSLDILDRKAKSLTRTAQLGFNNVFFVERRYLPRSFTKIPIFSSASRAIWSFSRLRLILATSFFSKTLGATNLSSVKLESNVAIENSIQQSFLSDRGFVALALLAMRSHNVTVSRESTNQGRPPVAARTYAQIRLPTVFVVFRS